jgi:hypothetical protein
MKFKFFLENYRLPLKKAEGIRRIPYEKINKNLDKNRHKTEKKCHNFENQAQFFYYRIGVPNGVHCCSDERMAPVDERRRNDWSLAATVHKSALSTLATTFLL